MKIFKRKLIQFKKSFNFSKWKKYQKNNNLKMLVKIQLKLYSNYLINRILYIVLLMDNFSILYLKVVFMIGIFILLKLLNLIMMIIVLSLIYQQIFIWRFPKEVFLFIKKVNFCIVNKFKTICQNIKNIFKSKNFLFWVEFWWEKFLEKLVKLLNKSLQQFYKKITIIFNLVKNLSKNYF